MIPIFHPAAWIRRQGFLGSTLFSTIVLFPFVGLLALVGDGLAGSLRD